MNFPILTDSDVISDPYNHTSPITQKLILTIIYLVLTMCQTLFETLLILFHFHFRLLSCLWRYQVVLLIAFFDYYKIWTYFTYLLDIWQHRFEILVSLFCPFLILSFWFIVLYISWHDFFPGTLMLFLSLCTCVCVCVSLCVDEKF